MVPRNARACFYKRMLNYKAGVNLPIPEISTRFRVFPDCHPDDGAENGQHHRTLESKNHAMYNRRQHAFMRRTGQHQCRLYPGIAPLVQRPKVQGADRAKRRSFRNERLVNTTICLSRDVPRKRCERVGSRACALS